MALSLSRNMIGLLVVTGITSLASCTAQSRYLGRLESVTLVAYHRMHPTYAETVHVAPAESFPLSDEVFSGRVAGYLPDFKINDRGEITSGSDSIANPAVKVEVYRGWQRVQASWAFPGEGPPHYRAEDMIGFRLLEFKTTDKSATPTAASTPDIEEGTSP